jgi:hypothetical protein
MGQMFDQTRAHRNNWRWDNPCAFRDQVNHTNPHTTSAGKVERTGEHLFWDGSDDLRVNSEPASCWEYKPGNFLTVRELTSDELIDEDDDDQNCADPGAPGGGRSRPRDDNGDDTGEEEKHLQGGEKWTGKGKGIKDGKGNGKGKGNGNSNGHGIVRLYQADSEAKGY